MIWTVMCTLISFDMKRIFFICLALCVAVFQAAARDGQVKVAYTVSVKSHELRTVMEFLDLEQMQVRVRGKIKGRKFRLVSVVCRDGVFTETSRVLAPDANSLNLTFTAMPAGPDSVKIAWAGKHVQAVSHYPVAGDCTLLELDVRKRSRSLDEGVLLLAYAPGIHSEGVINGKKVTIHNYCALRDAGTHPADWPARHGVKDFVYFYLLPYQE